jgi:type II secretory pathway predicted ATPase ExeA
MRITDPLTEIARLHNRHVNDFDAIRERLITWARQQQPTLAELRERSRYEIAAFEIEGVIDTQHEGYCQHHLARGTRTDEFCDGTQWLAWIAQRLHSWPLHLQHTITIELLKMPV